MMAWKAEWEGIDVMLHSHDIPTGAPRCGVRKGKWHAGAAAVLSSCTHESRRAVPFEFFPLYIPETEKHDR